MWRDSRLTGPFTLLKMGRATLQFMNVKTLVPLAVVAALGLGSLAPHAQTGAQKIGFVNVNEVLKAHPNNTAVTALQTKANTELGALDAQIKAIQAKGTAATPAEKDQATLLTTTLNSKAKDYNDQLAKAVAPIEKAVDAAVSSTAKAQGFSVIMDKGIAATSSLVIYADPSTDLTATVIKNLKP
jgi:outer membrane protein